MNGAARQEVRQKTPRYVDFDDEQENEFPYQEADSGGIAPNRRRFRPTTNKHGHDRRAAKARVAMGSAGHALE